MEYIDACKVSGGNSFRIIMKHLLPNCLSTLIVTVTLGIPNAIMSEASLSFLGLGVKHQWQAGVQWLVFHNHIFVVQHTIQWFQG